MRGELAQAESPTVGPALRDGTEPGMSLLRVAQGRSISRFGLSGRALDEAEDPITRSRLLPAAVEIMLEIHDLDSARAAADELDGIAAQHGAPYLSALSAHASGAVLLAEGDPRAALVKLRAAHRSWRALDAPHETARVRLQIGLACRELGDAGSAELEFEAARGTFEQWARSPTSSASPA